MLDPDIPVYLNEKQELGYYSYLYDERRNSSAGFFEKINYYFSRRMGSLLNTFKSAKVLGDKEYEKAAQKIEQEYAKMNKEISNRQKDIIKKTVKKFHSDPDALAKELSEKFGVQYVPNKNP